MSELSQSRWLPIVLLTLSNVFMTFAWYGHLKHKSAPLWLAILVSWGIAFFEYLIMVPANRWGSNVYTTAQLKVLQEVITLTVFAGFAVIYDSVGGDVLDQSLKCIAWSGRLLVIGFAGGRIPEIKANRILLKNIAVVGLHWGAYQIHEPARIPEVFSALFRMYNAGTIRPVIGARYPLDRVADALEALGSRSTHGKVVLVP